MRNSLPFRLPYEETARMSKRSARLGDPLVNLRRTIQKLRLLPLRCLAPAQVGFNRKRLWLRYGKVSTQPRPRQRA